MTARLRPLILFAFVLLLGSFLWAFQKETHGDVEVYQPSKILFEGDPASLSVEDVLVELEDELPIHYIPEVNKDSARMGEELVRFGRLLDKSNKRISKYFLCTDCHNQVLETDDPANESPERVLQFSIKNKIPFLPASTFYGMYNKRHWYNGDYDKKYGELVAPTRDSLGNAIQLCATQCSQGREMDPWEIRCVMHYFKSIELKVADLEFEEHEWPAFQNAIENDKQKAISMLKGKYNEINDAHFGSSEIPKIEGYKPDFENGHYIYEGGCLHCHAVGRNITNFDLGMDKLSFKFLTAKKDKYNSFSISHITRYGTYAISGRKQYMPQYSYEKMSDEQMLDLLFYIESKANE